MFSREVIEAIRADAIARYPNESCGGVTADGYVAMENRAADPLHQFDCADACAELQVAGKLLAVVHSHPDGPLAPSAHDIAQQRAMDVPWGLLGCDAEVASAPFFWGDTLDPPPLLGRPFRHGPSGTDGAGDCGALIRDWFRIERGITIPDFPREDTWWKQGKDLYADHYAEAGFLLANREDPKVGDVALIQFRSDVANHGGIYVGNGLIMHHLEGRLSREEPIIGWAKFVRLWLRHAQL